MPPEQEQKPERTRLVRNQRMDMYRGVAIYGVVFIHVLFPGAWGATVRLLALFGVPFFFLTAGFFSYDPLPWITFQRAVRTLGELILACIPFVLLGCWMAWNRGEEPVVWLQSLYHANALRELILFQIFPFPYAWQLWYLGALFLVYVAWFLITASCHLFKRILPYNALAALALVLLGVHLMLGEGAGLIGREVQVKYLRNALLEGFPFFVLGAWAGIYWEERDERDKLDDQEFPWPWRCVVLIGITLSFLEIRLAGRQELYLGTMVVLFGLMGLSICNSRIWPDPISQGLQFCGRELTLYIYTYHLLILGLIREVPALQWLNGYPALLPLLVAFLSTLVAVAIWALWNLI